MSFLPSYRTSLYEISYGGFICWSSYFFSSSFTKGLSDNRHAVQYSWLSLCSADHEIRKRITQQTWSTDSSPQVYWFHELFGFISYFCLRYPRPFFINVMSSPRFLRSTFSIFPIFSFCLWLYFCFWFSNLYVWAHYNGYGDLVKRRKGCNCTCISANVNSLLYIFKITK